MNQKRFTIVILAVIIAILVGAVAYLNVAKKPSLYGSSSNETEISWEECTKLAGSVILQTYPEQCVTSDGRKSVRPTHSSQQTIRPVYDKFLLWNNGTQLRGANIYQRRIYVELDGTEYMGRGPLGPPLTQADFDNLAKAGANLVVLSHSGLFDEKPPYSLNQSVQDNLDRLIDIAQKADLFVVIVARTGPGRSEFALLREDAGTWFDKSYINDEIWKDKAAQDAYVAMWRHTAERYRRNPVVIGFELMAEPNSEELLNIDSPGQFYPAYENSTYDWNVLSARISATIREVDKETPLLIGGLHYSGVRWQPYVKPTGDDRTVYTVHQYEPQDPYTHQKVNRKGELVNSYPGMFDTNEDGAIREFNKTWIDDLLGSIDSFRGKYQVPVAVTEYGVERWEPGGDRFLDDELDLFEKHGLGHAIWEWSTSYKPLTDDNNAFNYRFGPEPKTTEDTDSKLFNVIKKYWKKNTVRPSNFSVKFISSNEKGISWEECINLPGSAILQPYPGQCIAPDGRKAVRPVINIQAVKSSPALGNKAAVEIIVWVSNGFPVRNEIAVLRIGSKEFTLSRYPESGDTHTLIFTLTPEQFAQTATGDLVSVYYGRGGESNERWDLGTLDKSSLNSQTLQLPTKTLKELAAARGTRTQRQLRLRTP